MNISSSSLLSENARSMPVNVYLDKLFKKLDRNNDGRLSMFEFTQVLKALTKITGATLPKKEDVEDIFTFMDMDGDGSISKEEYNMLLQYLGTAFDDLGIKLYSVSNE